MDSCAFYAESTSYQTTKADCSVIVLVARPLCTQHRKLTAIAFDLSVFCDDQIAY